MTDRHHQLDNVTPLHNSQPIEVCCAYCDRPIHEVPDHRDVVRSQQHVFCNEFCLAEYVYDAPKAKPRPDPYATPNPPPMPANHKKADKTPARKAADSAAAFIGFFVWLAIISFVAVLAGIPLLL